MTHEARERLSKAMLQWGRAHVLRGLAETFVEEVGRAAIDLYGGRLKLRLLTPLETVEEVPQPLDQKPLVILVAGGTPIERAEALALIEACRVAEPLRSGLEPRISAVERRTPKALEALIAEAREADILLMLATNADAVVALAGIGNFFRAAHALVEPALILASISRGDEPGLAADMVEAAVNAYSGKVIAELEIQLPPAEDDYGPASPLGQALQRAAPHAAFKSCAIWTPASAARIGSEADAKPYRPPAAWRRRYFQSFRSNFAGSNRIFDSFASNPEIPLQKSFALRWNPRC